MARERLLDIFKDLEAASPNAPALYDAHAGTSSAELVTRRGLLTMASAMAGDLRRIGIGKGDCIGVWLPNWSQAVGVQLAALSIGAHVIGINTRYNIGEISHLFRMAQPRAVVIAHNFMHLDLLGKFRTTCRQVKMPSPAALVVTAPGSPPADNASMDAYDVGGVIGFPGSQRGRDITPFPTPSLATVFTTSGSTGKAKLAAHDERGIREHIVSAATAIGICPGDTMLGVLPLSGVFGFVSITAALVAGAAVLLEPVFDQQGVLDDMARYEITHVVGGDDLVGRIADAWSEAHSCPTLRWIGMADFEGRSRQLALWAEGELGARVHGVYGSSELLALATIWPTEYPPEQRWTGGGKVIAPSIRVRVVDPATGIPLPAGRYGEMQFRGPNVVTTYLGDPSLAEDAFTDDGWFRSGDLGCLLTCDTAQYVCRMGEALRLRGFLVDPSEIEVRLAAHPAVQTCKVVGIPAASGGTEVIAYVVPRRSHIALDEAELKEWCARTLAKYKVPNHIRPIAKMPTTSGTNGTKIRVSALRAMAAELDSPSQREGPEPRR